MKEIIKPTTVFKNVYVVQNYGAFRDMFYSLKEAKKYCEEEGTYDGECIYQIYKGTLKFEVQLYK